MLIYIPSSGRAHNQETIYSLPDSLTSRIRLVVPIKELETYREKIASVEVIGIDYNGIGPTRQWICEQEPKKVLMMDDDLVFATRRDDEPTKFRPSTDQEVETMVDEIEKLLEAYAHVGVATREGGNRNTNFYDYDTRLLRVLAYRTDIMHEHGVTFDSIPVMEDFHVGLNLLTLGYPNCKINWIVHNQGGSNSEGGCSQYRNLELQASAAHHLAKCYPDFVTVVEKHTKTAWGGQTRTDVRIQWKKALQSAKEIRLPS